MPFVIDASVTLCWAFDDEAHPIAALAFELMRTESAIAPSLWWFEVRNALIVAERRGRLAMADTTIFLRELGRLGVVIDHAPDEATVLVLARQHRLTVYDASYLALAQRESAPLATLDTDLRLAAKALDIPLVG